MHGVPPNDFPRPELAEFFTLQGRLTRAAGPEKESLTKRYSQLEDKMRSWPRSPQNDPFYVTSITLAERLSGITHNEVLVGFNEFCAPELKEALDKAIEKGADKIVVVTPMMTRGGEHAEVDIPATINEFRSHQPHIDVVYAWPYGIDEVAGFLAQHISRFSTDGR